jgi:hypothetical protein
MEATKQKEEKPRKKLHLSPRNRKACHSVSTALLQSVAEIVKKCPHSAIVQNVQDCLPLPFFLPMSMPCFLASSESESLSAR